MKQRVKKMLIVLTAVAGVVGVLYWLEMRGILQVQVVPGARTLYGGSVEIQPVDIELVKQKLNQRGCGFGTYVELSNGKYCMYRYSKDEGVIGTDEELEIFPDGPVFGPTGFKISENKVSSGKDIAGPPDLEKYKEEVRMDVRFLDNMVTIKEDSWRIDTKYPWTVVY